MKTGRVEHAEYVHFSRELGPLLLDNANDAAKIELDALHRQMMTWKKTLPPQEWDRLQAVVMGPHMAKADSLEVLYFSRLFGAEGNGERVIFAEGLGNVDQGMGLVKTHHIDAHTGHAYFSDSTRLHRDVLGDATKSHLDDMFPKTP